MSLLSIVEHRKLTRQVYGGLVHDYHYAPLSPNSQKLRARQRTIFRLEVTRLDAMPILALHACNLPHHLGRGFTRF